jgi:hypothetical protein
MVSSFDRSKLIQGNGIASREAQDECDLLLKP